MVYGPPATAVQPACAPPPTARRSIPQLVIEVTSGAALSDRYVLKKARIVRDEVSGAPPAEESLALTFFSLLHTTPAASKGDQR